MKTLLTATLMLAAAAPLAAQAQDGNNRRAERLQQRQEMREARQDMRQTRREQAWGGDRQENRQENRQDRREFRQENRVDRREFRQDNRADRREFRQDRRDDRNDRNRYVYVQPQNYYYTPPRTTYYYNTYPSYSYGFGYGQPYYGYNNNYGYNNYGYNSYGYGSGYDYYPAPRRWVRGQYLPPEYRRYIVTDYYRYGYGPPPRGYGYYRTNTGEIILAAIATGLILSVFANAF